MFERLYVALLTGALLGLGCGDGDGSGGSGGSGLSSAERACQLVNATMVTAAFEGTATEGVPGNARNCAFEIADGDVQSVSVFFFGEDSRWDGTRRGFEDNRGGTTDVQGIGDEAFYPNDTGPVSLIVRANGIIFQISPVLGVSFPQEPAPAGLAEDVAQLARAIVAN